jgi:hypothetical protein
MKKVALVLLALALVVTGCAKATPKPESAPVVLFHKDQLAQITGIRIGGAAGIGSKTTRDAKLVTPVVEALKKATPAQPPRDHLGTGHMIDLLLPGQTDLIELQYWTDGVEPSLFDIQKQQYWQVPGFQAAIQPLMPPKYLTLEDLLPKEKAIDPDAEWWPRFAEPGQYQVDGDQVWLLVGLTKDGRRLGYYLDPVSGKELGQDPPMTTDAAVAAVRRYFDLTGKGDYQGAWKLIHSDNWRHFSDPGVVEQQFLAHQEAALGKITGSAWVRDYWKAYTMTIHWDAVAVAIDTAAGSSRTVHVVQDKDGSWRLFWDSMHGLN